MASITEHGMMSCTSIDNVANYDTGYGFRVFMTSQARGSLYLKNQTTGAEKRIPLGNVDTGTLVWDQAADDPSHTYGANTEWICEFSGKSDDLVIQATLGSNYLAIFDGNGSAEASGIQVVSSV